ncbi:hypothetical protein IID19_05575 [Patescibacteria group bacterium]|nr:hypothetical protein [Patescibacteria group bacterium]
MSLQNKVNSNMSAEGPGNKSKTITIKINSNSIMVSILAVLLIVSVAQAVELGNLKQKITSGEVVAATVSGSTNSGSGSTAPSNLQDLPTMVGGC